MLLVSFYNSPSNPHEFVPVLIAEAHQPRNFGATAQEVDLKETIFGNTSFEVNKRIFT